MKLSDDLYAYIWENPYENNCNTYILGGEITVLIDPGHSQYLSRLFHQIEEEGISIDCLSLIILTHSHPDHFEGIEFFLDKPVKIAMSQEEEQYLNQIGRFLFEMMGKSLPPYRIDFFLKEGALRLKGKELQILRTPGHSPGSLSIYWPERKALFTGDLLFYGGVGRTDFPKGNSKLLVKSIERLSQLEVELLLPGHGEMVIGREMVLENFEFIRQNYYPYL
ncbi:MAG: MBL fold metallo-hydrolase [Thermodesulfobacteriota bacterium]